MQEQTHLIPVALDATLEVVHAFVIATEIHVTKPDSTENQSLAHDIVPESIRDLRKSGHEGSIGSRWRQLSVVLGQGGQLIYFEHTPHGLATRHLRQDSDLNHQI